MRRIVRIHLAVLAGLLLTAPPCWSQKVGAVAACEGTARMTREIDRRPMNIKGIEDLTLNCKLETGSDSRLSAAFDSDTPYAGFEMLANTTVDIRGERGHPDVIELTVGGLQMQGPGYVLTPECGVRGQGTEYIVIQKDHCTEVVGVNGHVEVEPKGGGPVPVLTPGWATSVGPEGIREAPHRLSDQEFKDLVWKFAFIGGGRAESQAVDHRLAAGEGLKEAELAPKAGAEWPRDEYPKWRDPVFKQPPGVVAAPQVGITY